jgi:hypothetical protein
VIFELVKLRAYCDKLWLQINGTSTYRKVGGAEIVKGGERRHCRLGRA